jgi:hypothetical protein
MMGEGWAEGEGRHSVRKMTTRKWTTKTMKRKMELKEDDH